MPTITNCPAFPKEGASVIIKSFHVYYIVKRIDLFIGVSGEAFSLSGSNTSINQSINPSVRTPCAGWKASVSPVQSEVSPPPQSDLTASPPAPPPANAASWHETVNSRGRTALAHFPPTGQGDLTRLTVNRGCQILAHRPNFGPQCNYLWSARQCIIPSRTGRLQLDKQNALLVFWLKV